MKFETQYKALSPNKSSGLNHDDIDKLAKLSWLAMGIYQYLLLHGNQSIVQLGRQSPNTPFMAICGGIDELVTLGFVEEVVGVEAINEGAV